MKTTVARLVKGFSFGSAVCGLVVGGLAGCGSTTLESGSTCQQSAPLRVCATGPTVQGVDVSKYQATVNWAQVKAAGIQFGFARISDGTANPDAYFTTNWQGMKVNGIIRGAYQYFRASVDPTAQATLVATSLQKAGSLQPGDLPVVLDIETADGQSETTIEANVRTWLAAVEAHTGRTPIVYTSSGTYPVTTSAFASYPLWVANYGATCPSLPTGWSQWKFWQTSSTATVNGISGGTDVDEFNGTLGDLRTFAGGTATDSGSPVGPADASTAHDAGVSSAAGLPPPGTGSPMGGVGMAASDGGASNNGGAAMGQAGNGVPAPDASAKPCGP